MSLSVFLKLYKNSKKFVQTQELTVGISTTIARHAHATVEFLKNTGVKVIEHSAYSPDLASCDFALFPIVKDHLKGKKFASGFELLAESIFRTHRKKKKNVDNLVFAMEVILKDLNKYGCIAKKF